MLLCFDALYSSSMYWKHSYLGGPAHVSSYPPENSGSAKVMIGSKAVKFETKLCGKFIAYWSFSVLRTAQRFVSFLIFGQFIILCLLDFCTVNSTDQQYLYQATNCAYKIVLNQIVDGRPRYVTTKHDTELVTYPQSIGTQPLLYSVLTYGRNG